MEPAEYDLMDAAEDRMWWYRALHVRLVAALADVHGSVLDAGCGTGGLLAALRARRPDLELVGLDWAEAACRRAAAKSGAQIVRGSANVLPFADASFDAVIAADLLCHRAVDPDRTLPELSRVLRPGGRLIVNMPAYAWLLSAHDRQVHNVRRQTAGQLATLLRKAGFHGVRARYWNGLLLPLMVVQRRLLSRGSAASDVAAFPPWLDAMLHGMTEIERHLPFALPAGGSVLAIAERP
ncbi:MAG TPA: class I SAM-dependent methyltransferase [Acetobacteraceae bacterium]|jgi:ubiquinone/menaquinone biosynthesis C-methylase UbiE|nr:class I SAM-dependent methyltransferase [Acetobacteraceae bacterium]